MKGILNMIRNKETADYSSQMGMYILESFMMTRSVVMVLLSTLMKITMKDNCIRGNYMELGN
jgi:hypothetical protein